MSTPFPKTYFTSEFVSLIAASILYGVTMVQAIFYYTTYYEDPLSLKSLVAFLWALDFAQLIFTAQTLFTNLIANEGQFDRSFVRPDWSIRSVIFTTGVIAMIVQLSLTLRVWRVSNRNRLVTGYLLIMDILGFCCIIALGVQLNSVAGIIGLSSAWLVDISVTISMIYFLHKRRTGIKKTDNMVHSLIIYAVNSGMITSLGALAHLVLNATLPTTLEYFSFYVVISKVYTNSFLGTLNARKYIQERANTDSEEHPHSNFQMRRAMAFNISLDEHEVPSTQLSKSVEGPVSRRGMPSVSETTIHSSGDA